MTQPPETPRSNPQPGSDDPSRWAGGNLFRDRYRPGRQRDNGALVWGLILLAIGVWFLLDQTLHVALPDIDWSQAWPVILIVLGGIVIFQSLGRRAR